jgi:hypothetical protein
LQKDAKFAGLNILDIFAKFAKSGESGKSSQNVGKSGESEQTRLANVDESGESEQTRLANVSEFSESNTFSKRAILASTRICQKWQISGEYSNLMNSLASGHSLL